MIDLGDGLELVEPSDAWDLSCPDWEERLREGRSLLPALPLWEDEAERGVRAYNKLRLADVPGTPLLADASGDWFRDIVRAAFGSYNKALGRRMIREIFCLVPKKNSKALDLDTEVATPSGFTTIRDIAVGDLVIGLDGLPAPVIGKSEVFSGRKCYELEFSTGEKVVCDEQHLWVTDSHLDRQKQKGRKHDDRKIPSPSVKTTREIVDTLHVKSGALQLNNHRISLCDPLQLPEINLPVHPYVLGAWLGDGTSTCADITCGEVDAAELLNSLRLTGHSARIVRKDDPRSSALTISIAEPGCRRAKLPYRFRNEAVKLGVLGNKHIPRIYLRASRQQRLELLRGLMDTDGHITTKGQASFTSTNRALAIGAVELIASLGYKPNLHEYRASLRGVDCGPSWRVDFWPFADVPVFTLKRKVSRQRDPSQKGTSTRSTYRQIIAAREVESRPTQCIAVGNESRQFLVTRSLIPTHNTSYGALLMLVALLLNQRPKAAFLMTAPVLETADMAFEQCEGAINLDPVLRRLLDVKGHLKTIEHRNTGATLEIVTFDKKVATGRKASGGLLIDELHVVAKMGANAASVLRQLRGGMMPFPEAFLIFITTQSEEPPVGVMDAELTAARNIRDGVTTGRTLPILYELPMSLQKTPEDGTPPAWRKEPALWRMVTPNLGRSIQLPDLVEAMKEAEQKGPAELQAWASQHLNIQVGVGLHARSWSAAGFWGACHDPRLGGGMEGLPKLLAMSEVVVAGIDGGGLDDLLALVVVGRHAKTKHWLVWCHAWANRKVLELRKSEAEALLTFEADGDLTFVDSSTSIDEEGKVIRGPDVVQMVDCIMVCEKEGLLDRIGVDQAGITDIVDEIADRKIDRERVVGIKQGWSMVGAIKTAERRIESKGLLHGAQRLLAYALGNAKVEPRGNAVIITKETAGKSKIDPVLAMLDATTLMGLDPKPRKKLFQLFVVGG